MEEPRVKFAHYVFRWLLLMGFVGAILLVGALIFSEGKKAIRRASGADVATTEDKYTVRYGETFVVKPREMTPWIDLPNGAAYVGSEIWPNPGWEKVTEDVVYEGSNMVEYGVPVQVGNSVRRMMKVRYKNNLNVPMTVKVKAWYPK